MIIDLPKEVENFVISEASRENISHSELIKRALARLADERRIQNYKNDRANQARQDENVKRRGSLWQCAKDDK